MVHSTRRFVLRIALCYFVLVSFSPFSIEITMLGEERAYLSAFRMFVRFALVWFLYISSWCLGRAAGCDCGTPWTFFLPFFQSWQLFNRKGMVDMDVIMTLLVPAKVLCNLWSYDFLWHDVIYWKTVTSYDKKLLWLPVWFYVHQIILLDLASLYMILFVGSVPRKLVSSYIIFLLMACLWTRL